MKGLSTAANHSRSGSPSPPGSRLRRGATRKAAGARRARDRAGQLHRERRVQAAAAPPPPGRRRAARLPEAAVAAHVVVVPVRARASAAAFATAVGLESPRLGLALAPLAAAVAYSRVHVGVHWTSDVVAGAALGVGVAALTRRWWPVRATDEALGPSGRQRARAARRRGRADAGQPALRGPPLRPARRRRRARCPVRRSSPSSAGAASTQQLEAALARRGDESVPARRWA